jgi:hypothetical protein
MFVLVDTRKADWDLMGSVGHELRHTIEVIAEPGRRPGLRVRGERPARPHPCREYEQDRVGAGPIKGL